MDGELPQTCAEAVELFLANLSAGERDGLRELTAANRNAALPVLCPWVQRLVRLPDTALFTFSCHAEHQRMMEVERDRLLAQMPASSARGIRRMFDVTVQRSSMDADRMAEIIATVAWERLQVPVVAERKRRWSPPWLRRAAAHW